MYSHCAFKWLFTSLHESVRIIYYVLVKGEKLWHSKSCTDNNIRNDMHLQKASMAPIKELEQLWVCGHSVLLSVFGIDYYR